MNNNVRYDRSDNFLELEVNAPRTIGILCDVETSPKALHHCVSTQASLLRLVLRIVSCRFPSLYPTLQADYVAKEVVAGTLRDQPFVIIPRTAVLNFALIG